MKAHPTTGSPVALVADNRNLADSIENYLGMQAGRSVLRADFSDVAARLDRDSNGLVLLAVAHPSEAEIVLRLVQDLCLQRYPCVLALIENGAAPSQSLTDLEPYLTRRLHWPTDAGLLTSVVGEFGRGRSLVNANGAALEELLSRRLLALTPSLLPLVDRIALAANHDVTVLLNGETGTGKTYLARLIHEHSPRKEHRFLNVPCGALSANLVESEFFGHVRGAFTGADRPKVGKFAAVGQGTLLLDEIDTLGLEQQATLLRVIETGEFEPVGSVETQHGHGRLIVASNIDLEGAVAAGKFRPDLFFRLNVMSFHLPPLRERVQDIAPLARGMAARFNRKFKKNLFDIHPEAMAALEAFGWPGNLRQLENVIQHAVLVSSGAEIQIQHLPPALQEAAVSANGLEESAVASLHHQRDLIERNVIQRALMSNGYSRTRAADTLGISRVTLYKKMKKYGLMKLPLNPAHV